jgi:acetoin utilization deacetylase AcuC-like enzyme
MEIGTGEDHGKLSDVGLVEDPRYLEHEGPAGHPERPDRLRAVSDAIATRRDRLERVEARPATDDEILRVHDREHLDRIALSCHQAPAQLDPDTYVVPQSEHIARLAAGASVDLALRIASGDLRAGLAAVRPPGHHAESDRAMGFCLFNNVAIAARAVQAQAGVDRVFLLDWDVHHGNGSQHTFEADPSVLFASTHQYPFYPGTGDFGERGYGKGLGSTVNIPLPSGCGDDEYVGALRRLIVPIASQWRPEMILVSCGFDAHVDDPLGSMQLSGAGFAAMTHLVRALADDLCGGRLLLVLEGGYALSGLLDATGATLDALLAEHAIPPHPTHLAPGGVLEGVVSQVSDAQGEFFSGLGAL